MARPLSDRKSTSSPSSSLQRVEGVMDILGFWKNYVIKYAELFTITDNGTVRIDGGSIDKINKFVEGYKSLFAITGM